MSSQQVDQLKDVGFRRAGEEGISAPPEAYTIVGLDVSAEKLTALYPATSGREGAAHGRARAIIKGVRDHTRVVDAPPPAFVASLSIGVQEPVAVANLGPDKNGKVWVLVCRGRQRTMGLRALNKTLPPQSRLELPGRIKAFPNTKDIDAELTALEANAASNVFVAMRPSQSAAHATALAERGLAPANIAIRVGARDAEHVDLLLMLAKCVPEVQAAVDRDEIALAKVKTLHKLDPDEQVRRVTRQAAGANRNAQNAAAAPRAKTRPARVLVSLADTFRDSGHIAMPARDVVLDVLAYAAGGEPAEWLKPMVDRMKEGTEQ